MTKFRFGAVPEDAKFDPEAEGWRSIREPNVYIYQLLAMPIGIVVCMALVVSFKFLGFLESIRFYFYSLGWEEAVAALIVMIVHEIVHGLTHPGWGLSSRTTLGIWPSKLVFFAHYEGEMERNRFLVVFLAPFLVLSMLPLLFAWATAVRSDWIPFVSVLNAAFASGDLLGFMLLGAQIPANTLVRNKGYLSYWKEPPGI